MNSGNACGPTYFMLQECFKRTLANLLSYHMGQLKYSSYCAPNIEIKIFEWMLFFFGNAVYELLHEQ